MTLNREASWSWSSNLDGGLGTGNKLFTKLSAGMHVVTLTARDSAGLAGTASVMVQVLPGADFPSVKIVSPADFSSFRSGGLVETLVGTATDLVDPTFPIRLSCGPTASMVFSARAKL